MTSERAVIVKGFSERIVCERDAAPRCRWTFNDPRFLDTPSPYRPRKARVRNAASALYDPAGDRRHFRIPD